ncbi:sulfate transporter-like isoform X1 [Stegodyphus dumicola]|uniref:sulfate transporter-like isoform X1 n=1 Tax=Stegodyphus dumicola TaxID=202533 RepID=UPI0015B31CFE|nr:sulfate transporter-like isoform X1 [Stegodyphus dumicola]
MGDKQHASNHDAKEYGTFTTPTGSLLEKSEKQQVNDIYSSRTRIPCRFEVDRSAMTQVLLDDISPPLEDINSFPEKVTTAFRNHFTVSCSCVNNFMKRAFPVLGWLPKYSIKNDLLLDVLTGFTLLILHVPQGMAYAQLASLPPVYGLYTSFYPVLVYFFLGTSRHVSMGTFAISSLLAGTEVDDVFRQETINHKIMAEETNMLNGTINSSMSTLGPPVVHDKIHIAMIITFVVGILQTAMGLCRMGYLTSFMSDEMISAFITGTVIHILTSQIKPLTGVEILKHSGPFNVIITWISFFSNIQTVKYVVILLSICSLLFLIVVKEFINGICLKKSKIPVPAELILVISGTLISKYLSLHTHGDVDVVGSTPTGLKAPELPPFELVPKVLTSSMILSIICAATTLSMVLIYAKKHEYEVDTNQELIAYGVGGIVSSFFFCFPSCGSLSRSAMQESTGAKSQICSLVSCMLMPVVLLVLAPQFEPLPSCVLSAIIVVSLKSMLMYFGDLKRAWKASKLDASVWIVTFLSVVILDMDYGLIIGILFSLITVLFRSQYPETCLLGNLPGTEIYRNVEKYPNVMEIPGVKIFHFGASIYFGNREYFRSQIFHHVSFQQSQTTKAQIKYQNAQCEKEKIVTTEDQLTFSNTYKYDFLKIIILELSAVAYMDSGGVAMLLQVMREFAVNNIVIYLACVQEPVLESLESQGFFKSVSKEFLFPTVHDAVLYAQSGCCSS